MEVLNVVVILLLTVVKIINMKLVMKQKKKQENVMIILITGDTHTGKTRLARQLMIQKQISLSLRLHLKIQSLNQLNSETQMMLYTENR